MPVINVNGHNVSLKRLANQNINISQGASPKFFLGDNTGARYIVKKPRVRTLGAIFRESLPLELIGYKGWTYQEFDSRQQTIPETDNAALKPYFRHLKDLAVEAALGEVLYMNVVKALFPVSMEVPESYMHFDSNNAGEPWVISLLLSEFNEFIEKKLRAFLGESVKSTAEWNVRRKLHRADLNFTNKELYLLGKLYGTALLTNDWDLVNNIMLSNSGCIGDSGMATKIAVVDGGNKFHFGFGGLTCEESSFENPQFNPNAKIDDSIGGYNFTLPFDNEVFLNLPRQIIADLFALDNQYVIQGFVEMVKEARSALVKRPSCIQDAVNDVFEQITEDSDRTTKDRLKNRNSTLLNHTYYQGGYGNRPGYILEKILIGRLCSLEKIVVRLSKGDSVETINQETLENYRSAQHLPH